MKRDRPVLVSATTKAKPGTTLRLQVTQGVGNSALEPEESKALERHLALQMRAWLQENGHRGHFGVMVVVARDLPSARVHDPKAPLPSLGYLDGRPDSTIPYNIEGGDKE